MADGFLPIHLVNVGQNKNKNKIELFSNVGKIKAKFFVASGKIKVFQNSTENTRFKQEIPCRTSPLLFNNKNSKWQY
jgi:hypothetical protein